MTTHGHKLRMEMTFPAKQTDPNFDKTFCVECGQLSEECKGHPESKCDDCGGKNVVWHAPNELWNKVCRPAGEICADPMLCPRCFILRAIKAGIDVAWLLFPETPTLGTTESSSTVGSADASLEQP